ncbi:hypothetical protein BSF41_25570 [Flavobacterium sp. ACN2]|jgi:hypothetical protein|nr:hypothetical protein BSF41_25570 [Flavobacterium sp. ACN2]
MILNFVLISITSICFQDVGFPVTLMLFYFQIVQLKIYGTKKVFKRTVNSINWGY